MYALFFPNPNQYTDFHYLCRMILQLFKFLDFSFIDIVDICLVALIIFFVFKWIKGSSAMNIFLAIIILLVARLLADALDMKMISTLLGTVIDVGAVALIVIFQPEIRRFLNNLGRSAGNTLGKRNIFASLFGGKAVHSASTQSINEIVDACFDMSDTRTGALIVLRKNDNLESVISTGDNIDASIRCRLIMNIFFKNSPLHDGAMVIGGDRLIAARCTLPITDRLDLPASMGMRHRAAVGISEQSDAAVIVVSEETGRVSFVKAGKVTEVKDKNELVPLMGNE